MNYKELKITFDTHPGTRTLYVTADGQSFFKTNDAHNHAKTLDDNKVTPVSAETVEKALKPETNEEQAAKEAEAKAAEEQAAKEAEAKAAEEQAAKEAEAKAAEEQAAKEAEAKAAEEQVAKEATKPTKGGKNGK